MNESISLESISQDAELISREIAEMNIKLSSNLDINAFLSDHHLDKNIIKRMIAWLVKFDLISVSSEGNIEGMNDLFIEYYNMRVEYKSVSLDSLVDKNVMHVINADVPRCIRWFHRICDFLEIDDSHKLYANSIVTFILVMISHNHYSYTQGFDRFAFATYALFLKFFSILHMKTFYAEALSYHLSKKLISLANFDLILPRKHPEQYFSQLDELLRKYSPDLHYSLFVNQQSSFHFALRWRLVFFSDELECPHMFLIWDHIIMRKDDFESYFPILAISYVRNSHILLNSVTFESLQHFKECDALSILSYAHHIESQEIEIKAKNNHLMFKRFIDLVYQHTLSLL